MSLRPRGLPLRRPFLSLSAAAGVALALSGCALAPDDLASPASSQTGDNVISVDGRVVEIPIAERGSPVTFDGESEHDAAIRSTDYDGRVYVVNFWYAACGPCRVEAPLLEDVWRKYQPDEVGFVGVNIYDQAATAISFAEQYGITYPSVIDVNDGAVKLAFASATPIQATPTTLVMDREGRVAARIIGQLPSASILSTLVADVLAEKP